MEVQQSSSSSVPIHDDGRKKHCWECRRRRLVCDSTQPTCNRCRQARIVCPGYEDHQPLRWLAPGKVTSRNRRPKGGTGARGAKSNANSASARKSIIIHEKKKNEEGEKEEDDDLAEEGLLLPLEGRPIFSKSQLVETIMRFELKCENFQAMKAVYNYTMDMYESTSPLKGLVSETRLGMPPVTLWRYLPAALKYMFVSLAMAHHINRLPPSTDRSSVSAALSVLWHWNGRAIRALNELISRERVRVGDAIIAGTLLIMACDLQQNMDSQWRHHFDGLTRMIELRGGLLAYWKEAPHMRASVAGLVITEAFANSTTPYNDQFTRLTRASQLDAVARVLGDGVFPAYIGTLCPPELLLLIIRINHLRATAATARTTISSCSSSQEEERNNNSERATELLSAVLAFSPERSAARAGLLCPEDWILFGRIYQSATALYCVLSLRAVGFFSPFFPSTSPFPSPFSSTSSLHPPANASSPSAAIEAAHYDRLLPDLKRALDAKPQNKSPLVWPLAVAGARARGGTAFERVFVEDALRDVGRHVGSVVPFAAAAALRRFWDGAGGGEGWDDCWDRAFCLLG
ncbi:fungal-specific transcription factor domain-containing protein [Biscogniauxia mediterranea]|nr:fungal-specific transcription factor domain-containing protein [Biscogniauxia mediterranea]